MYDEELRYQEMPEGWHHVERAIRDCLKKTTNPNVDSGLREALLWVAQCDPITQHRHDICIIDLSRSAERSSQMERELRGSVAQSDICSQESPATLPAERDHQAREEAVLTSAQTSK